MQPGSSTFRQLCGASIAYGLTSGGYNASEISIDPLDFASSGRSARMTTYKQLGRHFSDQE